jgi:hypothetical protein
MKHLLKEIVTRITDNLLGKSNTTTPVDTVRPSPEETPSVSRSQPISMSHDFCFKSQISARSSLCNQADLQDQYEKVLRAVNSPMRTPTNGARSNQQRTTMLASPPARACTRSSSFTGHSHVSPSAVREKAAHILYERMCLQISDHERWASFKDDESNGENLTRSVKKHKQKNSSLDKAKRKNNGKQQVNNVH